MIVGVTVERLGAVTLPHKAKILFTRKRSYIAVFAISLVFCIFNAPFLFTFGIVKNTVSESSDALVELSSNGSLATESILETITTTCSPRKNNFFIPYKIWTWYPMAAYNVVPFLILLASNITIITIITRAAAKRKTMSSRGKYVMKSCFFLF